MSDEIRHFLVWNLNGRFDRVVAYDNDHEAVLNYELAEDALEDGETVVLLGADRLATLLATHGNWFDEPQYTFETFPLLGLHRLPPSVLVDVDEASE